MPNNIGIGNTVFVPRHLIGLDANGPNPFHETIVRERVGRSVRVDMPGGALSRLVATSKITQNLGIMIVRIGDFHEEILLDPLAKSVLQFSRILLPDNHVRLVELRTLPELQQVWNEHHAAYRHVVLIGHGSADSILFGNTPIGAEQLAAALDQPGPAAKEIISLCCLTGRAAFAKALSRAACCDDFIAPLDSVHGCSASLFCQNYLSLRFIGARSPGVAFTRSKKHLAEAVSFRRWKSGSMK